MSSSDSQYGYWHYDPSHTAAVVGTILYLITTVVTFVQWIKYRAWVWVVVLLGVILELLGFIARIISTKNTDERGPYIVQFVLIIIAPVLMAAGFYVIFGRIVFRVLSKQHTTAKIIWAPRKSPRRLLHSPFVLSPNTNETPPPPRFLTPIFVTSDIVSFFVQTIGAGIVASTQASDPDFQSKETKGKDIVLVGLVIQICFFGLFSIIAARFHFVGRRLAIPNEQLVMFAGNRDRKRQLRPNWEALLLAVNFACCCILARSVYRVISFAEGSDGYAQTEEWTFWVFDFLPVFLCVTLFNFVHPGMYLPHLGFRQPKAVDDTHTLPAYHQ